MSENTPERLKQFRAENQTPKAAPIRALVAYVVVFLVGLVLGFGVVPAIRSETGAPPAAPRGGLSDEQLRQYALRLEDKQLPHAAIAAYEDYLDRAALDDSVRAKVCYSVARLAIDVNEYERALAHLYQAEFLSPDSDLREEIDKKIVLCLDKLGRTVDLRRELRQRTSVKRTADDVEPGEVVLAEFAGEVITDRDLDLEVEKLPASARESFRSPEKRLELLKNIVAERLLLDKANRLELDKEPEIQEELAAQRDALVVRKLISDEVRAKVQVTPEDVERFYRAEQQRFAEPAQARVRVGKAESESAAAAITEFPAEPVSVRAGGDVPGIAGSREAVGAIFETEADGTAGPVQIGEHWYVFRVESKSLERVVPFEEIREEVTRLFRLQKEQEQFRALIEETLSARDVRLYPERLQEIEEAP